MIYGNNSVHKEDAGSWEMVLVKCVCRRVNSREDVGEETMSN